MSIKSKKILAAAGFVVFTAVMIAAFVLAGKPLIEFITDPVAVREWADKIGFPARLAFLGMIVLQIIVAVIPGEPFEICAGYVFGAFEGTLICVAGSIIGGAVVFGLVRWLGVRITELFVSRDKINSLKFLRDSEKLNILAFILFFIPGTPKDVLTYFVGLTKMKFSHWIIITGTARLPSIITSTVGGSALGVGKLGFAIIVFAVTALISGIGIIAYKKICDRQNKKSN